MSEAMVVAQQRGGELNETTLECIGAAREIAGAGGRVTVLAVGHRTEGVVAKLSECDCDSIVYVDNPVLQDYTYDAYREVLKRVIERVKPEIILAPYTSLGMDLYPGLSVEMDIPLISDCISMKREDGKVIARRQLYGGKIEADYSVDGRCILTVRPGTQRKCGSGRPSKAAETVDLAGLHARTSVVGYETPPKEDVEIDKARIVISVGRGIEKKENLPLFEDLVRHIDGAVLAGSRPVIDSGWLPKGRQVGVSGKTVKPKLYIALGISGAIQHLSGMSGSEFIVAVNRDRDAPIFKVANVGIVDDIFKFVPALINQLGK